MNGTRRRCKHKAEESARDKRCTFAIHARLLDAGEQEIICASHHRIIRIFSGGKENMLTRQFEFQSSEIKTEN